MGCGLLLKEYILFTGDIDPKVAIIWFDKIEVVLGHMGCSPDLWVRLVVGTIYGASQIWWRSIQSAYLGDNT